MNIRGLAVLAFATILGTSVSGMTLSEDFNDGTLNGFDVINFGDGTIQNGGPDGDADPYLSIEDTGSGFMAVTFGPEWLGDLSDFDEGIFSVDFIQTDQSPNGSYIDSFGTLLLTGGGRTVGADLIPVDPSGEWQSISAMINAATFGVTQTQWEDVLADVTQFAFRAESWVNPSETVGLDNIQLQSTTAPVPLPAGAVLLVSALGLLGLRRRKA